MSNLGGAAIGDKTFQWIKDNLPEGKVILEIGSGTGTRELIQHWTVHSIEQNHNWATVHSCHDNYIYAPIKDGWYDLDILKEWLPEVGEYHLLIIDGPKGAYGNPIRNGFYENRELFNLNVPLIFDDCQRPDESKQMEMISEEIGRPFELFDDKPGCKFGVIK